MTRFEVFGTSKVILLTADAVSHHSGKHTLQKGGLKEGKVRWTILSVWLGSNRNHNLSHLKALIG